MPAKMKIRSAYSALPSAERKVADFILENPERAPLMVINEIAAKSGVSVPSVTRLAKKLGYSGFLDFRVALASDNSGIDTTHYEPVSTDDSDEVLLDKMYASAARSQEDTFRALDKQQIILLAEHIANAKRVFIAGKSVSALLAKDFALQLNFFGVDAIAVTEQVALEMCQSRFSRSDVFIGLSRSGKCKQITEAMKIAKQKGSVTAFLSNYVNAPAAQVADFFFCTSRDEDIKAMFGRETNNTMMAVLTLLMVLVSRKCDPSNILAEYNR